MSNQVSPTQRVPAELPAPLQRHATDVLLWTVALLLFVAGDLATTWLGLRAGAVESHPILDHLVHTHGLPAMLALKAIVVVPTVALSRLYIQPVRYGFPLALIAVGAATTTWNAWVLGQVMVV